MSYTATHNPLTHDPPPQPNVGRWVWFKHSPLAFWVTLVTAMLVVFGVALHLGTTPNKPDTSTNAAVRNDVATLRFLAFNAHQQLTMGAEDLDPAWVNQVTQLTESNTGAVGNTAVTPGWLGVATSLEHIQNGDLATGVNMLLRTADMLALTTFGSNLGTDPSPLQNRFLPPTPKGVQPASPPKLNTPNLN